MLLLSEHGAAVVTSGSVRVNLCVVASILDQGWDISFMKTGSSYTHRSYTTPHRRFRWSESLSGKNPGQRLACDHLFTSMA